MNGATLQAATQIVLHRAGVEIDCSDMPDSGAADQAQIVAWAGKYEAGLSGRFIVACRVLIWFVVRDLQADDWTEVDRWASYAGEAARMAVD